MTSISMTRAASARGTRLAGFLCLALIAALLFALVPAAQANAVVRSAFPDGNRNTEIIITKLMQPETISSPANGLQLGADVIGEMTPLAGVTFEAKLVPAIDLTTNAGQVEAASMTVAEALSLTANEPVADSGVTGADGVLALGGANGKLGVGLYVVEETDTPAGVVGAAPFIIALPLTSPTGTDWMYTAYVYPKNSKVEVRIGVEDASVISYGDTVTWTTHNVIPDQSTISHYVTQNVLAPDVYLKDLDAVEVSISGPGAPKLVRGTDYVLVEVEVDGRRAFNVEFTEAGRAKLVAAKSTNRSAQVVVEYPTSVEAAGVHTNEVRLYVDDAKPVIDRTVTKFGPLRILVFERGNEPNVIADSVFRLYLSEEDARQRRNPITVGGMSSWTTDAFGYITIEGLRYSGFANGLDQERGSPLYRGFWVAPDSYPPGWTGETEPLTGSVSAPSIEEAETLIFRVWKGETPVPPLGKPSAPEPPKLPVTGGQIAGIAMLGALLIGGGALMFVRRRRGEGSQGA